MVVGQWHGDIHQRRNGRDGALHETTKQTTDHVLPTTRDLKLGKEMVGLLISKHFGDFGWGQGKIKGYNSKRKFPFEIKWSDEQKSRFHQLTLDEYMEGGKEREAKAGDFTILVKVKEK